MFCSKCGAKIDDGIKFCGNCGSKVEIPMGEPVPVRMPMPEMAMQPEAPVNAPMPEMAMQPETPVNAPMPEMAMQPETPVNAPMPEMAMQPEAPVNVPMPEMAMQPEAPVNVPMPEMAMQPGAPVNVPMPEMAMQPGAPVNAPMPEMAMQPARKKSKAPLIICLSVLGVFIIALVVVIILANQKFDKASQLLTDGQVSEALDEFRGLFIYRGAGDIVAEYEQDYENLKNAAESKDYTNALDLAVKLHDYEDAPDYLLSAIEELADAGKTEVIRAAVTGEIADDDLLEMAEHFSNKKKYIALIAVAGCADDKSVMKKPMKPVAELIEVAASEYADSLLICINNNTEYFSDYKNMLEYYMLAKKSSWYMYSTYLSLASSYADEVEDDKEKMYDAGYEIQTTCKALENLIGPSKNIKAANNDIFEAYEAYIAAAEHSCSLYANKDKIDSMASDYVDDTSKYTDFTDTQLDNTKKLTSALEKIK